MKTARNISAYEGHDSNDSLYFKMNYPYIIWTEKCSELIDRNIYHFHQKSQIVQEFLYVIHYKRKNKNITIILSTHVVVIF